MERLNPPFLLAGSGTVPAPVEEIIEERTRGDDWLVTVFDNDVNTYEEVIVVLMVATRCSIEEARIETWEIDHLGSSVVHCGAEGECRNAGEIISSIGIRVEVSRQP